jgi:hypothetical protein
MNLKSGLLIITFGLWAAQASWNNFAIARAMQAPQAVSCTDLLAQKEPARFVQVDDCIVYHGSYVKHTTSVKLKRMSGSGAEIGSTLQIGLFATRESAAAPDVKTTALLHLTDAARVKSIVDELEQFNRKAEAFDKRFAAFKSPSTSEAQRRAQQPGIKAESVELDKLETQLYEVRPLTLKLVPGEDFSKFKRVAPEQYAVYEEVDPNDVPGFWTSLAKLVGSALLALAGLVWLFA